MDRGLNAPRPAGTGRAKAAGQLPSSTEYTPIFAGRKLIGKVSGGVFLRTFRGSVHFLKKPSALAVDVDALESAERAGATWARFTDAETHRTYCAPLALFRERGFHFNRGFGFQVGLALDLWTSPSATPEPHFGAPTVTAARPAEVEDQEDGAAQLGLFGELEL